MSQEISEEERKLEAVRLSEKKFSPHVDKALAGKLEITFPNLSAPIELVFDRVREDHRHTCRADLQVFYRAFGRERPIFTGRLALRGPRNKTDAAKECQDTATSFLEWGDVIQVGCEKALAEFRMGEPFQNISDVERRTHLSYAAWPVVIEHNPSIIFGMGGLGKSLLAVYLGVRVSLGENYNDALNDGLVIHKKQNVLYLDWEADESEVKDRWASICDGLGVAEPPMRYRRMSGAFASQLEAIRDEVISSEISFICIDSAQPAVGGEAESAQATEEFFEALRDLRVSSIIIAHQSKPQVGLTNNMPFGSTFWWNLGRSIWQIEAEGEGASGQLSVAIIHRKVNSGTKHDALGFEITFTEPRPGINDFSMIRVDKLPLASSDLRESLDTKPYIEATLLDPEDAPTGELTIEELVKKMPGKKKDTIQQTLSRGKRRGDFWNDPESHKWSVTSKRMEEIRMKNRT